MFPQKFIIITTTKNILKDYIGQTYRLTMKSLLTLKVFFYYKKSLTKFYYFFLEKFGFKVEPLNLFFYGKISVFSLNIKGFKSFCKKAGFCINIYSTLLLLLYCLILE